MCSHTFNLLHFNYTSFAFLNQIWQKSQFCVNKEMKLSSFIWFFFRFSNERRFFFLHKNSISQQKIINSQHLFFFFIVPVHVIRQHSPILTQNPMLYCFNVASAVVYTIISQIQCQSVFNIFPALVMLLYTYVHNIIYILYKISKIGHFALSSKSLSGSFKIQMRYPLIPVCM